VLAALLYASYLFFHDLIFKYVVSLEEIGFLLIDRLVSVGFLAFFFMLIISSFITALASMFRSTETEYLFSTPLSDLELLVSKYIDVIIYSSWAILFMALPILHAYARARNFGALEYALTGIFVLVPFILIATAIGTILAMVVILLSKYISTKRLVLLSVMLFAGFMYLIIHFSQQNQLTIPFTEDFRALNVFLNNFRLNAHPFTPNFWLIQCLRSLVLHNYRDFNLYTSALISTALFFISTLLITGEKLYFKTWRISNERLYDKSSKFPVSSLHRDGFLSKPSRSQGNALLKKDVLLLLREPSQWAQVLLLLALLALYVFNLRLIPEDLNNERWHTILSVMNFGFCGFVLATLAVRFVFPSISLESNSFWVLGSSPLSASTLFREKFIAAFVAFVVIAEPIALISGAILKFEGLYYVLTAVGIILMSISLTCLAVGMGAAFPDFSERNPSRIATSPGGILTIVISLIYIGVMMVLIAIPSYQYTIYLVSGGEFPEKAIIVSLVISVILNTGTIVVPLLFGARSLARREF
jgi:ABC-2 type transport system permease protein